MKLTQTILWLGVLLGIGAAISVGIARDRWESGNRRVELAVRASDVWEVVLEEAPSFPEAMESLMELGLQTVIISPLDVQEVRERFFPYRKPDGAWLSPSDIELLIAQGGRLYWELDAWVPAETFPGYLKALLRMGPGGFLVSHPLALGVRDAAMWAELLQAGGARLGLDELSELPDSDWVRALRRHGFLGFVRLHRLSREERAALTARAFIARELRAVRERNVRLLELRALRLDQLKGDVTALRTALQQSGFSIELPQASLPFSLTAWTLGTLWLGLISLLALMVSFLTRRSPRHTPRAQFWVLAGWGLGVVMGILTLLLAGETAQIAFAWLAATAVPIAAFIGLREHLPQLPSRIEGMGFWLALSTASLLGGMMSAGFLSEDVFFLKIAAFPGVKAALVVPVVAITGIALAILPNAVRKVRLLDVAVWLGVGLLLALALLRSGNVTDWPFLDAERIVRDGLEGLFGVRPRFKEFLIGHPALILWAGLGDRRWRPASLAWLSIGLLGQVSIINSFLHLHTPLTITVLRTLYGLGLGTLIGWLVQTLLFYADRLFSRSSVH
jgi:hypothetical protein